MGLPPSQRRALESIERRLRAREPALTSKFAIFTRLTQDEVLPHFETITARWWDFLAWSARSRTRATVRRRTPGPGTRGTLHTHLANLAIIGFIPFLIIVMVSVVIAFSVTAPALARCPAANSRGVAGVASFAAARCVPPGHRAPEVQIK